MFDMIPLNAYRRGRRHWILIGWRLIFLLYRTVQAVDSSLKNKLTSRAEYDRVIGEAEQAYMKILESSQVGPTPPNYARHLRTAVNTGLFHYVGTGVIYVSLRSVFTCNYA